MRLFRTFFEMFSPISYGLHVVTETTVILQISPNPREIEDYMFSDTWSSEVLPEGLHGGALVDLGDEVGPVSSHTGMAIC